MEFDIWESMHMEKTGDATYSGEIALKQKPETPDIVTEHAHTVGDSTLTISSPLT